MLGNRTFPKEQTTSDLDIGAGNQSAQSPTLRRFEGRQGRTLRLLAVRIPRKRWATHVTPTYEFIAADT